MLLAPNSNVRVFSIEEANALIPRLNSLIGELLELGAEIQRLVVSLWELLGRDSAPYAEQEDGTRAEVIDITLLPDDSAAVRDIKRTLADDVERYREGWHEVEATGAVVKDTTTGLLDFYGHVGDRLVWLCWRHGEDAVEWYHELDAGFAGRKSLGGVRKLLLN
jgi:hypothetical protein